MKNICFFNSAIAWGGGEKWHLEVSDYLYTKGYNITVMAHGQSELLKRLKERNIPNIGFNVGNLSFLNPFKLNQLKRIFKARNIDTIVINLSRDLKLAGLAAKNAGVTKVIYRRGSAIPIRDTFLNRFYFKNVITDVLANSMATKNTVLEKNPKLFPQKKIKVIYNAMDTSSFNLKNEVPKGKNKDEITLVNLGRLEAQKNQKFLIHLMSELKKRDFLCTLLIGGEGRLKKELQELATALNVSETVVFCGFIANPEQFLKRGDIFVLSSLWEGFGYVLAEASLCEKPIVAFDISSNPEVVQHEKTGYLTPLNDVKAFVDAVVQLAQNSTKRNKMGKNGRAFIENTFEKKIILKQIEEYIVHGG